MKLFNEIILNTNKRDCYYSSIAVRYSERVQPNIE